MARTLQSRDVRIHEREADLYEVFAFMFGLSSYHNCKALSMKYIHVMI